ncbi:MAG: DUF4135 domain-containing protein [Clostridium sp.]|uniref:DUF4135 domain-containing protein n=1 Tax=Clostridium sp. TaxID=1506 RepID=UPI003F3319C7
MHQKKILFSQYYEKFIERNTYYNKLLKIQHNECFSDGCIEKCKLALVKKLNEIGKYALTDYYNTACEEDNVTSYDEFIKALNKEEFIDKFESKYPVLVELLNKKMSYELDGLEVIVENIITYFDSIRASFGLNSETKIQEIDTTMGDCHKEKVVAKLVFDNSFCLMYKMRETVGEKIIWGLSKVLDIGFSIPSMVKFDNFYLQEFIESTLFDDTNQVKEYYRKFGRMAAVFASLGTTDLHSENVIATKEGPKFIDLETIITISEEEKCFNGSAIRNTMLFRGSTDKIVYTGMDLSAFSGGRMQGEYVITDVIREDDKLFIGEKTIKMPNNNNVPVLKNGGYINPNDYRQEVLEGFDDGYREILYNKDEFIKLVEENLVGTIRKVIRNTAFYSTFLQTSYMPTYLESYTKWNKFFDLLSIHSKMDSHIIQQEKSELRELLIPLFECNLNEDGEMKEHKKLFIKRLQTLDYRFFEQERNVILLSFELDNMKTANNKRIVNLSQGKKTRIDYECMRFINYTCKRNEFSYVTMDKAISGNLLEYTNDIFTFGGALITLALIDHIKQEVAYKELIKNTVSEDYRINGGISGLTGSDAQDFLLTILSKIYNDKEFLDIKEKKNSNLSRKNKEYDNVYDFSAIGSAILARVFQNKFQNKELLDDITANYIGEYNAKFLEREAITGLFHGYSGDIIVFSILGTLLKNTDVNKLLDFAKLENQYYEKSISNWNDIRGEGIHDMVAVSYGAPGILLARICLLLSPQEKLTKQQRLGIEVDIRNATNKILTMKRTDYYDDTLINGFAGGLLGLKCAMELEKEMYTEKEALAIEEYILSGKEYLEATTWRIQEAKQAYLPNFMNGNMGIIFVLVLIDNFSTIKNAIEVFI